MASTLAVLTRTQAGKKKKEMADFAAALGLLRQILGATVGVASGLVPLLGWNGFIAAVIVVGFLPFWWSRFVAKVTVDEEEGQWSSTELLQEGTYLGMVTFLLCWITVYSALHTEASHSFELLTSATGLEV